jgi:hypothetical protein
MTTLVSKNPINLREKLTELDRPVGIGGQEVLKSESVRAAQNTLGVGRKNLLLNSQFHINQRGEDVASGVTISGVNNYFTVDRWNEYHNSGVTRKVTITYNTKLPDGTMCNSYKSEYVSGAANWMHPVQQLPFENWMHGQTFTVSSWVKTNIQGFHLRVCDTVSCYLIGNEIPSDGEWHYMTGQITFPDSGLSTSANTQWQPAFGSTTLQAGDYVEFACMQVEVGTVATPFEWRTYEEELQLCQAYYWKMDQNSGSIGHGNYQRSDYFRCWVQFPVKMRDIPTLDVANGTNYFRILSHDTLDSVNTFSLSSQTTRYGALLNNTAQASGTQGSGGDVQLNSSSAYVAFDAEVV